MNVLSLFDGMSCGRIALDRAGIKVTNYFASEIEKSAIAISKHNWPDIIHLGDVTKISGHYINPVPDLIIAGSPCQGFSQAGEQLAFDDPRSRLFFEFVRILKEVRYRNPNVLFLLENVEMKQEHEDTISNILQCEPSHINSNLVSVQNRKRVYWSNFFSPGFEPENKGLLLYEILEEDHGKQVKDISAYTPVTKRNYVQWDVSGKGYNSQQDRAFFENGKFGCFPNARATTKRKIIVDGSMRRYRDLNWTECERLQTVPDGYTQNIKGVSEGQALCALGNGWTVDVIAHIFKHINP